MTDKPKLVTRCPFAPVTGTIFSAPNVSPYRTSVFMTLANVSPFSPSSRACCSGVRTMLDIFHRLLRCGTRARRPRGWPRVRGPRRSCRRCCRARARRGASAPRDTPRRRAYAHGEHDEVGFEFEPLRYIAELGRERILDVLGQNGLPGVVWVRYVLCVFLSTITCFSSNSCTIARLISSTLCF